MKHEVEHKRNSISQAAISCSFYIYKQTNDEFFDGFPKISEDFRKISEDFRGLPKISEITVDFWGRIDDVSMTQGHISTV